MEALLCCRTGADRLFGRAAQEGHGDGRLRRSAVLRHPVPQREQGKSGDPEGAERDAL